MVPQRTNTQTVRSRGNALLQDAVLHSRNYILANNNPYYRRRPCTGLPAQYPADPTSERDAKMKKEMLINVLQPEECRIAVLEDGQLEELYMERKSVEAFAGNIYRGKIVNLEPSIQAAFVDFGVGRNGFLHISDVEPQYFRQGGYDPEEIMRESDELAEAAAKRARESGRGSKHAYKGGRPRVKPPIQEIFKRGDEVLVQVIKEGIGTKGPTLSTYLSIPGRYLVLMPSLSRIGVSRKIEDEDDRKRLKRGEGLLEVVAGRQHKIFVDGRLIGRGPVKKIPLKAGEQRHEIRVKMKGEERVRYVVMRPGVRLRVRVAPPWSR